MNNAASHPASSYSVWLVLHEGPASIAAIRLHRDPDQRRPPLQQTQKGPAATREPTWGAQIWEFLGDNWGYD